MGLRKGVKNKNRPKKRGKISKARRKRVQQTQDVKLRMAYLKQNHEEPVSQNISLRRASMKRNHEEPVSQNISEDTPDNYILEEEAYLRMQSLKQNQEEPVSQTISKDLHDNCVQDEEVYLRKQQQEEAGPSSVKPPYVLKESKMLVNVAFFVKSLQSLNNHGGDGCNFSDMYISGETNIDCNVGIELSCAMCFTTAFVWMEDPRPDFLEQHPSKPPTSLETSAKKTPVIAEKVPIKNTSKRKPPPPPRPPCVPRSKSIRQNFMDNTSNSINSHLNYDIPFIKQEIGVPEDGANPFLNQLPLSSAQPATVQLLFSVENSNNMPLSSDENVSLSPGAGFWNHQTSSVIGLRTRHSANETIVPELTPIEVLPVDLNLVKAEINEESQSMEVDNLPSVRIIPMSETSINCSETAFASESFTETSTDSALVTATSVMASTYATESGVLLVSDILSAKDSSISSYPASAINQTMFQHGIASSKEDFLRQTVDGPSNNIVVNLNGKIKS